MWAQVQAWGKDRNIGAPQTRLSHGAPGRLLPREAVSNALAAQAVACAICFLSDVSQELFPPQNSGLHEFPGRHLGRFLLCLLFGMTPLHPLRCPHVSPVLPYFMSREFLVDHRIELPANDARRRLAVGRKIG